MDEKKRKKIIEKIKEQYLPQSQQIYEAIDLTEKAVREELTDTEETKKIRESMKECRENNIRFDQRIADNEKFKAALEKALPCLTFETFTYECVDPKNPTCENCVKRQVIIKEAGL